MWLAGGHGCARDHGLRDWSHEQVPESSFRGFYAWWVAGQGQPGGSSSDRTGIKRTVIGLGAPVIGRCQYWDIMRALVCRWLVPPHQMPPGMLADPMAGGAE